LFNNKLNCKVVLKKFLFAIAELWLGISCFLVVVERLL
jgi:hypothetical protein